MRLIDADAFPFESEASVINGSAIIVGKRQGKTLSQLEFVLKKMLDNAPTVDAVSPGVLEQYKWERDTAIAQLEELGIGFGQKKPDMVEVVRCRDCRLSRPVHREDGSVFEGTLHCFTGRGYQQNVFGREYSVISPNSFCAAGKRKMDAEVENDA